MIGDPFTMVVAIIAIVTIGKIIRNRHDAKNGIIESGSGKPAYLRDPDTDRMRDEIKMLKDRIQVLERIATDGNSANDINRQIEELRDR